MGKSAAPNLIGTQQRATTRNHQLQIWFPQECTHTHTHTHTYISMIAVCATPTETHTHHKALYVPWIR